MELYMRFMVTLACGLLGVGMVLKVLLDGLFHEWDAVADMGEFMRTGWHQKQAPTQRVEDVMLEIENARTPTLSTSIYEQKRRDLKELSAIESSMNRKGKPVVLTPIPPPSADIVPS
ncbi:MAG: hypothetical protein HY077_00570 [Elusimicrobia bacterium]|nr:hypothetical protein [Elusimicrobiota bacterium]